MQPALKHRAFHVPLSHDHFRPGAVNASKGPARPELATTLAAPVVDPVEVADGSYALAREDLPPTAHQNPPFRPLTHIVFFTGRKAAVAAWRGAGKARQWTRVTANGAATFCRRLLASRRNAVDPLEELATGARYAAVSNRLAALGSLSETEQEAVRHNMPNRRIHQAGSDIAIEGERAPSPMFIASGWVCRVRVTPHGRRQIVGFLLPGDAIGMNSAAGAAISMSLMALTGVETVSADGVLAMARDPDRYPGIRDAALALCTLEDAFLVNQIMRLGAMTEEGRIAHLLLELHWRLTQARLATDTLFPLPLAHDTLADALAMKPRAVKAALNKLARIGAIACGYGRIEIRDPGKLLTISGFAPPTLDARSSARPMLCDVVLRKAEPSTSIDQDHWPAIAEPHGNMLDTSLPVAVHH